MFFTIEINLVLILFDRVVLGIRVSQFFYQRFAFEFFLNFVDPDDVFSLKFFKKFMWRTLLVKTLLEGVFRYLIIVICFSHIFAVIIMFQDFKRFKLRIKWFAIELFMD